MMTVRKLGVVLIPVLIFAACSSAQTARPPTHAAALAASTTTTRTPTRPTAAMSATSVTPRRSGDQGFVPQMLIRASGSVVYLLGTVGCETGLCGRLLRSSDDGLHFERVTLPKVGHASAVVSADAVLDFQFSNPGDGYLLNHEVLYVTNDGARTWHVADFGPKQLVLSIAATSRFAYATLSHCAVAGCEADRLVRSIAGSSRWTVASDLRANNVGGFSLDAAVGERVWLGTGGGTGDVTISLSVTEGKSFQLVWSQLVLGCDLTPTSDTVVWLDCSGGMEGDWYRSTDGGRHFRYIPYNSSEGAPFDPVTNMVAFYLPAAGVEVYRTTNAGASFQRRGAIPVRGEQGAQVSFANPARGLALVSPQNELFRTSDGGATWMRVRL
jgi:photosystem II stability/assembly factor-like uncharacterized protein